MLAKQVYKSVLNESYLQLTMSQNPIRIVMRVLAKDFTNVILIFEGQRIKSLTF